MVAYEKLEVVNMDFVAIDFETANSLRTSACSVGIVVVRNGEIIEEVQTLINPLSEFNYYNTKIHGITDYMVQDAPTFQEFWPQLKPYIDQQTIIAHNASFDIGVLKESVNRCYEEQPQFQYACSYRIAKKIWPDLYNHKLSTVANYLSIQFKHHDALEDARAAALITIEAMKKTRTSSLKEMSLLHKIKVNSSLDTKKAPSRVKKSKEDMALPFIVPDNIEKNTRHPFYGANIVFTGKMDSMTRSNAAKYAADRGATCKGAVDIDTNFLVVGDQALMKYVEGVKSSKMQKAEDLIQKGIPLEIVGEQDFLRLVKH
ncbi:exonuclease domain-containing protein [Psychrobacillus sp. MER TA 171]|nr:exonuclease domain-containing protein [Psychrobacillus sp. MER TA 171]